jgi:hypothetical protein
MTFRLRIAESLSHNPKLLERPNLTDSAVPNGKGYKTAVPAPKPAKGTSDQIFAPLFLLETLAQTRPTQPCREANEATFARLPWHNLPRMD